MSTYLSKNPSIDQGTAVTMAIQNLVSGIANIQTINAAGNVAANYFVGDGSQLTGLTFTLPPTANIDISGNVIGEYANISNLILSSTFIALGENAGSDNQQPDAVAIGSQTGYINQGNSTLAAGTYAGRNDQGDFSVALGAYTANYYQGQQSVAIGTTAGEQYQGRESVAIGMSSGQIYQGNNAVAIGASAGYDNQGANSVAIGASAGYSYQGNNSVSIGAYGSARGANSIVINATGSSVVNLNNDTFVVKPVRGNVGNVNKLVMYDTSSGEITYNTSGYIGNIVTGQVNVTGNVVLSLGKSVFASQMPFFWSSPIQGNPQTGGNLIVTGVMADSATYIDAQYGVRLTTTTNAQTGSIRWNVTNFDFTKDFNVRTCIYMSSNADGIWVGFGASDPGAGVNYANANGGLAMRLWTYIYNYTIMYGANGLPIGQTQNNNGNLVNEWLTVDTTVRTIGSRKYLHVFAKNALQNAVDVTGWTPAGNFIYVGASTGAANANHYVNHIEVKYI
jgi:hypothetical protein